MLKISWKKDLMITCQIVYKIILRFVEVHSGVEGGLLLVRSSFQLSGS